MIRTHLTRAGEPTMQASEKKEVPPEAVMDAYRLARSGNYRTATQLKKAFAELYPDLTPIETASVFSKLARLVC